MPGMFIAGEAHRRGRLLLSNKGEVVGVNTWNLDVRGVTQNINFAISIMNILKALEVRAPQLNTESNKHGNTAEV